MREIVELPEFTSRACKILGTKGRDEILDYVFNDPKAGKSISGLGGIRKLDWNGEGKKGAEFAVYFHPGNKSMPLVLICLRKRNEKQVANKVIELLLHNKIERLQ